MLSNNIQRCVYLIFTDQYLKNTRKCHRNYGVNFGILVPFPYIFNMILVLYLLFYDHDYSYLVVTGGLSNLIDRLYHGYVKDYIYLPEIKIYNKKFNYICNLADIYVILGLTEYVYRNGPYYTYFLK